MKAIVIGAGISGLSAARELSKAGADVLVLEKEGFAGGLSATHADEDGFVYDRGPHYFFSTLSEKIGISDKCFKVPYYESILYKNKDYFFPFGLLLNPRFFFSVAFSYGLNLLRRRRPYNDLGELLDLNYGRSFTKEILSPLIEKWSGEKSKDISADFGQRLLPGSIDYVIYSIIKKIRGYTEDYYQKGRYIVYPKNGMKTLFDKLKEGLKVEFNSPVKKLNIDDGRIVAIEQENRILKADYFISSMPVDELLKISSDNPVLKNAVSGLKYRGVVFLYLKIKEKRVLDKLWYWYPEKKYPFYRVSEQIDINGLNAKNNSVVVFELGSSPSEKIWSLSDKDIYNIGVEHLRQKFNLDEKLIIGFRIERSKTAYPVLLKDYEQKQRALASQSGIKNLFLVGRTGLFKYYMLEEAYDSGVKAAELIKGLG